MPTVRDTRGNDAPETTPVGGSYPSDAAPRILIVKPSALGDVVLTIPAARLLRRAFPGATLGWLVNSDIAPLIEPLSCLDHVHRFERRALKGFWSALLRAPYAVRTLSREMRSVGYDAALDVQGLFRSAYFAKRSGARRRIGFRAAREFAPVFYTEKVVCGVEAMHAADRYIEAARRLGAREAAQTDLTGLETSAAELASMREVLVDLGVDDSRPLVTLCPGARWKSKAWPVERWVALADGLRPVATCVLAGSRAEQPLCGEIVARARGTLHNLAGLTDLRQLAALLATARLVAANDSGPMHMAAAQGTPLIALFGPTDPALTGPWRRPECVIRAEIKGLDHRAYRKLNDDRVMRMIGVERVLARALELLSEGVSRKHDGDDA